MDELKERVFVGVVCYLIGAVCLWIGCQEDVFPQWRFRWVLFPIGIVFWICSYVSSKSGGNHAHPSD